MFVFLDAFGPITLAIFMVVFFFLACMTYGLSVSRGVFIPCLVLGASWGRLFGIAVAHVFPGEREHYVSRCFDLIFESMKN